MLCGNIKHTAGVNKEKPAVLCGYIKHTAGVNKEKPAVIQDDEELAAMQEEPALMQDDVSIHGDLCGERYWDCHDRIWMLQNYF